MAEREPMTADAAPALVTATAPGPAADEVTLLAVRERHSELVRLAGAIEYGEQAPANLIEQAQTLIQQARQVGAVLELEPERRGVQSLIDYWSTFLSGQKTDAPSVTLEPFDKDRLIARADSVYQTLPVETRVAAEKLLTELVAHDDDDAQQPSSLPRAELLAQSGVDPERAGYALDVLLRGRIVSEGPEPECAVSLINSALGRYWPPLRILIEDARQLRRLRAAFRSEAASWGRDHLKERLWRGVRYEQAKAFKRLSPEEAAFFEASRLEDERDLLQARHTSQKLGILLALSLVMTLIAVAAGIFANSQYRLAQSRQLALRSIDLWHDGQLETAPLVSVLGYRRAASLEASNQLLTMRQQASDEFVGFLGAHDRNSQVWGLGMINTGQTALTAGEDGMLRRWDIASRSEISPAIRVSVAGIYGLAVSHDQHMLATGDGRGTITLWRVDGAQISETVVLTRADQQRRTIFSLDFNPDRTLLAVGVTNVGPKHEDNCSIDLYQVTGLSAIKPITSLAGCTNWIWQVHFSPNGQSLLATTRSMTNNVLVWDMAKPLSPTLVLASSITIGNVTAAAFHPSGESLLVGDVTGRIYYFGKRASGWALSQWPLRIDGTVRSLAYDASGGRLIATSDDRNLWLFETVTPGAPKRIGRWFGQQSTVLRAAFAQSDTVMVSTGVNGWVGLWKPGAPPEHVSPVPLPSARESVSHDGVYQAAIQCIAGSPPCVQSQIMVTDTHPGGATIVMTSSDELSALTWSPTDKALYFGRCQSLNKTGECLKSQIYVVEPPWTRPRGLFTLAGAPVVMAVGPGEVLIAAGSTTGKVMVWNMQTGQAILFPDSHADAVSAIGFSADGASVASGSKDKTVMVWDLVNAVRVGDAFRGHYAAVTRVEFGPGLQGLTSTDVEGEQLHWSLSADEAARKICQRIGRDLNAEERKQFAVGVPYTDVCP